MTIIAVVSAVPGIGAAIGAFFWFGRLSARIDTVEREVSELKSIAADVAKGNVLTATIEERTKNTDRAVAGMADDLRAVTRSLLDEGRSFARELVRQRSAGPIGQG